MERTQQLVDGNGLQIPLPFMAQYGLHPGSEVTVELDVIRIVPKYPNQAAIEKAALKLLLKSLGDAVLVKAKQFEQGDAERNAGDWRVDIHARDVEEPLGHINYAKNGELLSDLSTSLEAVRQKAATLAQAA